jgi:hypothetical protein
MPYMGCSAENFSSKIAKRRKQTVNRDRSHVRRGSGRRHPAGPTAAIGNPSFLS